MLVSTHTLSLQTERTQRPPEIKQSIDTLTRPVVVTIGATLLIQGRRGCGRARPRRVHFRPLVTGGNLVVGYTESKPPWTKFRIKKRRTPVTH